MEKNTKGLKDISSINNIIGSFIYGSTDYYV